MRWQERRKSKNEGLQEEFVVRMISLSYARDLIPSGVSPRTGLTVSEKINADPQVPEAYEPAAGLGRFLF
jgi:hypothetical protein